MLKSRRVDLDHVIEQRERRQIVEIIDAVVSSVIVRSKHIIYSRFEPKTSILSLGGGTWTIPGNRCSKRAVVQAFGSTATFEHCWLNISFSRKERPLAHDRRR